MLQMNTPPASGKRKRDVAELSAAASEFVSGRDCHPCAIVPTRQIKNSAKTVFVPRDQEVKAFMRRQAESLPDNTLEGVSATKVLGPAIIARGFSIAPAFPLPVRGKMRLVKQLGILVAYRPRVSAIGFSGNRYSKFYRKQTVKWFWRYLLQAHLNDN